MTSVAQGGAPLDDVMLAMDVVDTLRHEQNLVTRELGEADREAELLGKLREIYRQQGIEVPDRILKEGVAALRESRFVYDPPRPGLGTTLARLYVQRGRWGRPALAVLIALVIGIGGYFGVYRPMQEGQREAARIELAEAMPAQMQALYQTIFEETKVQQAANDAEQLLQRGQAAAREGDRAMATQVIADLTTLRDTLRQDYQLRVVNQPDVRSGFWRIPDSNTAATNYYVTVEALDRDGNALSLPIANEETGKTDVVKMWGLRVPEGVYRNVEADKRDNGIIEDNLMGVKTFGFLVPDYTKPVLGGAVTEW